MTAPTLASKRQAPNIELADGETAMRYRDLLAVQNALASLATKHLPLKEARIHIAGCIRALKPHVDDHQVERVRIMNEHSPSPESASEGDSLSYTDPIGMKREMDDLDWGWCAVRLPKKVKPDMLPINDKNHPQNELGLSAILADLGPLYPIDIQYDGDE